MGALLDHTLINSTPILYHITVTLSRVFVNNLFIFVRTYIKNIFNLCFFVYKLDKF